MSESIITRGSQITLTKDVREKMGVKEGDIIIMNTIGNVLIASKRDPNFWKKPIKEFLPSNFEKTLSKMRSNPEERLKRLGII